MDMDDEIKLNAAPTGFLKGILPTQLFLVIKHDSLQDEQKRNIHSKQKVETLN